MEKVSLLSYNEFVSFYYKNVDINMNNAIFLSEGISDHIKLLESLSAQDRILEIRNMEAHISSVTNKMYYAKSRKQLIKRLKESSKKLDILHQEIQEKENEKDNFYKLVDKTLVKERLTSVEYQCLHREYQLKAKSHQMKLENLLTDTLSELRVYEGCKKDINEQSKLEKNIENLVQKEKKYLEDALALEEKEKEKEKEKNKQNCMNGSRTFQICEQMEDVNEKLYIKLKSEEEIRNKAIKPQIKKKVVRKYNQSRVNGNKRFPPAKVRNEKSPKIEKNKAAKPKIKKIEVEKSTQLLLQHKENINMKENNKVDEDKKDANDIKNPNANKKRNVERSSIKENPKQMKIDPMLKSKDEDVSSDKKSIPKSDNENLDEKRALLMKEVEKGTDVGCCKPTNTRPIRAKSDQKSELSIKESKHSIKDSRHSIKERQPSLTSGSKPSDNKVKVNPSKQKPKATSPKPKSGGAKLEKKQKSKTPFEKANEQENVKRDDDVKEKNVEKEEMVSNKSPAADLVNSETINNRRKSEKTEEIKDNSKTEKVEDIYHKPKSESPEEKNDETISEINYKPTSIKSEKVEEKSLTKKSEKSSNKMKYIDYNEALKNKHKYLTEKAVNKKLDNNVIEYNKYFSKELPRKSAAVKFKEENNEGENMEHKRQEDLEKLKSERIERLKKEEEDRQLIKRRDFENHRINEEERKNKRQKDLDDHGSYLISLKKKKIFEKDFQKEPYQNEDKKIKTLPKVIYNYQNLLNESKNRDVIEKNPNLYNGKKTDDYQFYQKRSKSEGEYVDPELDTPPEENIDDMDEKFEDEIYYQVKDSKEIDDGNEIPQSPNVVKSDLEKGILQDGDAGPNIAKDNDNKHIDKMKSHDSNAELDLKKVASKIEEKNDNLDRTENKENLPQNEVKAPVKKESEVTEKRSCFGKKSKKLNTHFQKEIENDLKKQKEIEISEVKEEKNLISVETRSFEISMDEEIIEKLNTKETTDELLPEMIMEFPETKSISDEDMQKEKEKEVEKVTENEKENEHENEKENEHENENEKEIVNENINEEVKENVKEKEKEEKETVLSETEMNNPKYWKHFIYYVEPKILFERKIGCIIRAKPGSIPKRKMIKCDIISSTDEIPTLDQREDYTSYIFKLYPSDDESASKLSFESPWLIAIPYYLPESSSKNPLIMQMSEDQTSWVECVTYETIFDNYKQSGLKFVETKTSKAFGTFAVVSYITKDRTIVNKEGTQLTSTTDRNIVFSVPPDAVRIAINTSLRVTSLDPIYWKEIKEKHEKSALDSIYVSSSVVEIEAKKKKLAIPAILTLGMPTDAPKEEIRQVKRKNTLDTLDGGNSKIEDDKNAVKKILNPFQKTLLMPNINSAQNMQDIHFLSYLNEEERWNIIPNPGLNYAKTKEQINVEMPSLLSSKYILLKSKRKASDEMITKAAKIIDNELCVRNCVIALLQSTKVANDFAIIVSLKKYFQNHVNHLQDEGYLMDSANKLTFVELKERQILKMEFVGNIKNLMAEYNVSDFAFHSLFPNTQKFRVKEIDSFAQKAITSFRGYVDLSTKTLVKKPVPGPDGKVRKNQMQYTWIEENIMICHLLISIKKKKIPKVSPFFNFKSHFKSYHRCIDAIKRVSSKIGTEWWDLGILLNVTETRMHSIKLHNQDKTMGKMAEQMLLFWLKGCETNENKIMLLISALKRCGRLDIVERLQKHQDKSLVFGC